MTITSGYATLAQVCNALGIPDGVDDAEIEASVEAASRWIDKLCGRRFYIDGTLATDVTARIFRPSSAYCVKVDDFASATNLVVKTSTGDDLTYDQTWAASDYELRPLNQLGPAGQAWAYNEIATAGVLTFPSTWRACVQVTARWGWPAVPDDISMACTRLASFVFRSKDSPLGVAAFTDMGAMRARTPSVVLDLIAGYERESAYGAPQVA